MVKDLSYATINSVNTLYLITDEIDGYIEESNGNTYQMILPTYESKYMLKTVKNYGIKSEILLDQ